MLLRASQRITREGRRCPSGRCQPNGDAFRDRILSRGRTEEPRVLFEKFYGGPPQIGPLLEYRGLAEPPRQERAREGRDPGSGVKG